MRLRVLVSAFLAFSVLTAPIAARAQVEPALPSWSWDKPVADKSFWSTPVGYGLEVLIIAVAADIYFGRRISTAVWQMIRGGATATARAAGGAAAGAAGAAARTAATGRPL